MWTDIKELLHAHPQLLCVIIPLGWVIVASILRHFVSMGSSEFDYEHGEDASEAQSRAAGCFLMPLILLFFGVTKLQRMNDNMNPLSSGKSKDEDYDPIYYDKN